jgi:uncharacterized protein YecE (DUF72 family)
VTVIIGTSGWQYRDWRGRFYPQKLPQRLWLEHYAAHFATVESNNAFYRLPEHATFVAWRERSPPDFRWAVKASRFLTHIRRLRDPADSVRRLMDGAARLGDHLGPILIQLPPDLPAEPARLAETLAAFPPEVRVTVEPRHASWFSPEIQGILRDHRAALCWADRRGPRTPVEPDWATAPWGYVRFHGGSSLPPGCYGEVSLARWLERIRSAWPGEADVFLYWNNDHRGCAPRDAGLFASMARRAGIDVTRAPDPGSLRVG